MAKGSSVPPWPTRRTPVRRRTRATTSCDVGPAGLAATRMPSSRGPSARRAAVTPGAGPRRDVRPAPARPPGLSARGSSIVAPAARACPPPPKAAGQRRGVHATVPGAHGDARPRALVLEEDGHVGRLRLGEQVDEALGQLRSRVARGQVPVVHDRPHDPAVGRRLEPREDASEEAQLGVRLGAVDAPRDHGQRRARGQQLARHAQRPGRRVGVLEVGRVDDEAGHEVGGDGAVEGLEAQAQVRQEQGHLLAGRGGRGIHPVDGPEARVREVVVDVDDGHPGEQLGVLGRGPRPTRSRSPQSQTTMRSGSRSGSGERAEALDVGHEVVHRGDRVGADRVHPRAPAPRARGPRTAPSRAHRPPGRDGRRS